MPVVAAVGAGVVVAGALAWIVISQGAEAPPVTAGTTIPTVTALALDVVVPPAADVTGQLQPDGVVFAWTNPDPQPGDTYDWHRTDPGADPSVARVQTPTVTVTGVQSACIEVEIVRDNGSSSAHGTEGCAGQ